MNSGLSHFLAKHARLNLIPRRYKSQRRCLGKPPGVARSLEERLSELNFKDPKVYFKVDIGFKAQLKPRREVLAEFMNNYKKNHSDPTFERLSRENKLLVSLDKVEEDWMKTVGPQHIRRAAEYYKIYEHLFGDAYFNCVVPLKVSYEHNGMLVNVYRGNYLKPSEALNRPEVSFKCARSDSLWTLILSTPDGQTHNGFGETIHWIVTNIKGNDVSTGEEVVNYFQPLPFKGTGYYRYVFVLYKQDEPLNSSKMDLSGFSSREWYRKHQKVVTPAGLSFFQADWDDSVTKYNHENLKSVDPVYSYDFPPHYNTPQKWFPLKQAFDLYLDRYRDPKQIAKEYLVKKLKTADPFKPPASGLKYPNAIPFKPFTPSWLKTRIRKERLKQAQAADYL